MVKNENNALPLEKDSNLNVFGWASTNPIYGGTGSDSSDSSSATDILTSLADAGFKVNQDLIDMYKEYSPTRNLVGNVASVTYTDEQPMREIYLKPFEMSVKNFEGNSLAVMSSFNFIGDVCAGANPNLLNTVLRDECGFRGMVLSDWNGSYGYQNTDDFVRNGNDAMLGFMQHESNAITNTGSATLVIIRIEEVSAHYE